MKLKQSLTIGYRCFTVILSLALSSCTLFIAGDTHYVLLDDSNTFKDIKLELASKDLLKDSNKESFHKKPVIVKIDKTESKEPVSVKPVEVQTNAERRCAVFILPTVVTIPSAPIEKLNKIASNQTKQLDDIMLSYIRELIAIANTNQINLTRAYDDYIKKCDSTK